jgi:hypothetical protein
MLPFLNKQRKGTGDTKSRSNEFQFLQQASFFLPYTEGWQRCSWMILHRRNAISIREPSISHKLICLMLALLHETIGDSWSIIVIPMPLNHRTV